MEYFFLNQKEKEYISDSVYIWIKNRNKVLKDKGFKVLDKEDEFVAFKVLINKKLPSILEEVNRGNVNDYLVLHTGRDSRVEVKEYNENDIDERTWL